MTSFFYKRFRGNWAAVIGEKVEQDLATEEASEETESDDTSVFSVDDEKEEN